MMYMSVNSYVTTKYLHLTIININFAKNKIMNKHVTSFMLVISVPLTLLLIGYVLGSFSEATLDIREWEEHPRDVVVRLTFVFSIFIIPAILMNRYSE